MYRVRKALNHNTLLAVSQADNQEYLIIGKGIGFGKKVSQRFELPAELPCTIYSLKEQTERGSPRKMLKSVDPVYLEIAGQVLGQAQQVFGRIDQRILFPMADHIAFAVQRIKSNEQIHNPLTDDIRALFHMEYKVAESAREILRNVLQVEIDDHEIGYIALHIHAAIEDEAVAFSMQMARMVRHCIDLVEAALGKPIDVRSLSYNRLMNHIRYMTARAAKVEKLKLNMNDYISAQYPEAYAVACQVCRQMAQQIPYPMEENEIGYLAMHIGRVMEEQEST